MFCRPHGTFTYDGVIHHFSRLTYIEYFPCFVSKNSIRIMSCSLTTLLNNEMNMVIHQCKSSFTPVDENIWRGYMMFLPLAENFSSLFLVAPLTPYLGNSAAVVSHVVHFHAHVFHRRVFVWRLSGQNKQKDVLKHTNLPVSHIHRKNL